MDIGHWESLAGIPGLYRYSGVTPLLFDSIVSRSLSWGVKTHTNHRLSAPC